MQLNYYIFYQVPRKFVISRTVIFTTVIRKVKITCGITQSIKNIHHDASESVFQIRLDPSTPLRIPKLRASSAHICPEYVSLRKHRGSHVLVTCGNYYTILNVPTGFSTTLFAMVKQRRGRGVWTHEAVSGGNKMAGATSITSPERKLAHDRAITLNIEISTVWPHFYGLARL